MSTRQPTFRERIRLLMIASAELEVIATKHEPTLAPRLREVTAIIDAEVARMERAATRWEQKAAKGNEKAPTPKTLHRATDAAS